MSTFTKILFIKFILSLFCLFTGIRLSFSQNPEIKTFGLQEENKRVQVNVIFKNKAGYIYAGTNNGLFKFDGSKYYPLHFANKNYTDTVTAIFQDKNGKYWIGFKSGKLANLTNDRLAYLELEEGHPAQKITAFLEDKEGNIWISTNGEGIYYFNNKRLYLINAENGLPDANISTLALAANGEILAASDQGLICIDPKNKNAIRVIGPAHGLPDYIVTSISPCGRDSFWIGMQDKGFCLYDHVSRKISAVQTRPWTYGQVNALLTTQAHLYIATQSEGIFQYDPRFGGGQPLKKIIAAQTINSLLQDSQGNIWGANPETGLVRASGDGLKFFPLPKEVVFEHIHALLADRKGAVWVTNSNNEILKLTFADTRKIEKIKLSGITKNNDITSLYQDTYNNIWIGTVGKGLYVLDFVTHQYRPFGENELFRNATILSVTGHNNKVFVSSLQGSMIINLRPENSNIKNKYLYSNFATEEIASNYIYHIFQDSKGKIWFATDGRGLSVFDRGRFTNYSSEDLIKDDRIYSITEDRAGNIWFSTASAGIYKFDGNKFRNYGLKEGLSELNISAVKTDKKGNIIIIHKKGLDVLDPSSGKIAYINSNKGITQLNVEDLGAVAQDQAGKIYVSSPSNIVVYTPETTEVQQPKTILESVQLFLTDLDDYSVRTFSHEENNFTFNYTGLYYTDPEQIYYQYKLEGFDTSWVLTKDRSKTFPKLAPGKYKFRIQSALNKSFTKADEASFAFEIKKAFYSEWWFIAGVLLLLGVSLYAYIRNRESSINRMQRLQHEKIRFRFEVLRNQVNPHFLFNSFNTLISTIEDDPRLAVEYVEQLSDFFRSIVNYRDKDIIPLHEEIELLNTYYFLQGKRYGDNLKLEIHLTEEDKNANLIPPLTLQLLMENAIKHNAITKDTPLLITIGKDGDDYLTVLNNINNRLSKEAGAGMGLQNIISRYQLLSNKHVKVDETSVTFKVSLPLIKMNHV